MTDITIFDLQPQHCRYILASGFYCGEPRANEQGSYCTSHHELCYQKGTGSKHRHPIALPVERLPTEVKPDGDPAPLDAG